MCGIAGIINLNQDQVSPSSLQMMMNAMKHRGPDDEGIFIDNNLGLGFVRLSILDLSAAGHQPMHSSDGKYVIIFNGEIFNYIELREELKLKGYIFKTETDTEVLINSYIEWGEDCQHKFNGMWAFAVYDKEKSSLFISRDRYGIKPFYYFKNNEIFAFASEIPPLLKVIKNRPEANNQAIFDYLIFNRTDYDSSTFFKNVFKLQHGHSLKIQLEPNVIVSSPIKWYNLKKEIEKRSTSEFSIDEFQNLFEDSIRIRLRSDVPIGVCLSGGLDSSAVVSTLIKKFNKHDLNTFSAVYNHGQTGDESMFIDLYKHELRNMYFTHPNHSLLIKDLVDFISIHAEPIPSTSPYAQYKVMETASNRVVVTLDGQGADEMLGGYHYFFGFYFKDLLSSFQILRLIRELFYYLKIHKSTYGVKTFIYFLLPSSLRTKTRVSEKSYLNKEFVNKYSNNNPIASGLYASKTLNEAMINHFEFKLEHLLKWADCNSMAFSVEARVPFLDHRLVETTLNAHGRDIIVNGMTKYPLRKVMNGILPEKIRMRTDKMGFETPEDEWFREKEFQLLINDVINSKSFQNRNIFNVSKIKLQYSKHLSKEINISKEIWKWLHLELWFRKYIDRN